MSPLISRLAALQLQAVLMTGAASHEAVQTIGAAIAEIQRLTNQQKAWMAAFSDLADQVEQKAREADAS